MNVIPGIAVVLLCLLTGVAMAQIGLLPRKILSLYALLHHYFRGKAKFVQPRSKRKFNFDEVIEGILVGTQPRNKADLEELEGLGVKSIICLNEEVELYVPSSHRFFDEMSFKRLCIPVPDYQGPTVSELNLAVEFIQKNLTPMDKVFVHCNGGKGRSASVVLAYLLATSKDMNVKKAYKEIKSKRSCVSKSLIRYPFSSQARNLNAFEKQETIMALKSY